MDNTITVSGNLTRDFELRYTTSGRAVASSSVAVARRFQRNGEWEEETSFINVVAWGDLGEHCAASLEKGSRVIVTGRLEQRHYETKEGEKRSTFEIIADDIGPSLKWAEARVERVHRDGEPRKRDAQPDPVYGDEEPFVMLADIGDVGAVSRRGHPLLVRPWN